MFLSSPIKLLILDIDGTIAGISNSVRQPVIEAIAQVHKLGIPVGIATGRMFCSALRFYQSIGASLPLICYNGALIKDPKTQQIYQHLPVPISLSHQILDFWEQAKAREKIDIHFYINDQLYVQGMSENTRNYLQRSSATTHVVSRLRETLTVNPTKILVLSQDPELIKQISLELGGLYSPEQLHFTTSTPHFLEITHPLANKGRAIQYLAETLLGLEAQNVMAIGDNFNDVEMLEYAGVGIAMGNSPKPVQAIANWIAPDVEADGVVTALETFLLIESLMSGNPPTS